MINADKEKLYKKVENFVKSRDRFLEGDAKASQEALDWWDDIVSFVDDLIDKERKEARE
ncbi:hypothetical protein Lw1_gp141 [Escherichia phage Lw1]|uniref:Uncharacterized protein n=1 Tax=Escherichia phage Lw1 TaxID=1307804 RepID=M9V194_9CAUD|nr:hypothetical protein Lw1_gp141 [Escherichia phage Lw1]AGJ71549.1 hypothetical protein Lw1_gp141 [Escherichia phage Lw1]